MAFRLRRPPLLGVKHDAYSYQLEAVRAVKELPYAAIFHEQGLGKTKIAIDLILFWLQYDIVDTVFVVTKKTLVPNWTDEIRMHSFLTPRVLSGDRRRNSIALNAPVLLYVLNYEVVLANRTLIDAFLGTCRVAAILDESQKIKNPESRLTGCFQDLSQRFRRRIIMTGTPAANRPYDLWSQIRFLDGGSSLGGSYREFKRQLDLPGPGRSAEEYALRLDQVFRKIAAFSVRKTKRTAGIKLPGKTVVSRSATLAPRQAEIYASYRDQLACEVSDGPEWRMDDADAILKRLLRLVQCASNPGLVDSGYAEIPGKYPQLQSLLEDIDLQSAKVVVWTQFVENAEWLRRKLAAHGAAVVHGGLSMAERTRALDRFKATQECTVLVATPGAAKEGLTLTVANHTVFYDRSFSLDDYIQAQDRIHRISQSRHCYVHNLIAEDTIDEWVDALLYAKYHAAQLAQGDIGRDEFVRSFATDLSETLAEVLGMDRQEPWRDDLPHCQGDASK